MIFARTIFFCAACSLLANAAHAGRGEFDYGTALPAKKKPIEVLIRRNPFQGATSPERPLPVLRDREDPVANLPGILTPKIRSVIRGPRPLLLIDGQVFQPGDELRSDKEPVLPKYRVLLKSIEDDRVILHVISLDPQQPGQLESVLMLPATMRKS